MQKTYELMVLLHPDLEIDAEAPISKIESLVEAAKGRVIRRDNWGKKRLAYRVARQDFAIYVYFEIQMAPANVVELERTILITEEVLRHILVVHEEPVAKPDSKKATTDSKTEESSESKSDEEPEAKAPKRVKETAAVTEEEGAK